MTIIQGQQVALHKRFVKGSSHCHAVLLSSLLSQLPTDCGVHIAVHMETEDLTADLADLRDIRRTTFLFTSWSIVGTDIIHGAD